MTVNILIYYHEIFFKIMMQTQGIMYEDKFGKMPCLHPERPANVE